MVENPVANATYWSVCPSDESSGYGDMEPRQPWKGQLEISNTGGLRLIYMNYEGRLDSDSNASSFVYREELFETEKEARKAYIKKKLFYVSSAVNEINRMINELEVYINDNLD